MARRGMFDCLLDTVFVRGFTGTSRMAKKLGNFAKWRIVYPVKARWLPSNGLCGPIIMLARHSREESCIRKFAPFAAHAA